MDMQNIETFFLLFSVFSFGWIMGQIYMAYKIRENIKQVAEQHGITLQDIEESLQDLNNNINVINVQSLFTESIGHSIMLYTKSGNFLCQGSSLDELAKNAFEHSKINFAVVKHNDREMFFVEGKIKTTLE